MWVIQNLIKPHVLGNEMWGKSIGHLKILDVQPNLKFNMFHVLLACFSYHFWTYSKSFLAHAYFPPCPLTISTTSLEWSLHPMGMEFINFLASFPNTNSNRDIFVMECNVEL